MSIVLDLENYDDIPKIIHISWKNKNILDNNSHLIVNGIANMKRLNPNYQIVISDDNDIEQYIKKNIEDLDYQYIKDKKIVEKVDLWRLLKMYYEGGIYTDIDRYCNISFDDIIGTSSPKKCILPTYLDQDFSQDLLISCENNPIFLKAIQYNLIGRTRGLKLYQLGSPLFMLAVTNIVFGEMKNINPGENVMENYRNLLNNSKYFLSYREEPMNNTLLYRNISDSEMHNNKLKFYNEQGIIPWYS